jgi:hypothetical protein
MDNVHLIDLAKVIAIDTRLMPAEIVINTVNSAHYDFFRQV